MTELAEYEWTPGDNEMPLAEVLEQITQKLQGDEPFELEDYLRQYPACSASIRELLPTLRDLSNLGRSLSGEVAERRSRHT